MKNLFFNIIFKLFFSFFVLSSIYAYSQNKSTQKEYLEQKLQKIDEFIATGNYTEAIELIKNTQNTFSLKENSDQFLELKFRYAKILYEYDQKEKALEELLIGLEKSNPNSTLYIEYLSFLAKVFARSRNYDKALYYSKIALKNSKINNDTVNVIKSLVRVGSFYFAKNNLDSAKYFYRKVEYYPVTPKTENRISDAYNNLGVIAEFDDNYSLAKYYATLALKTKQKFNDTLGIAYSNVNLGNLYYFKKKYKNAIKNYDEALNLIKKDSSDRALEVKKTIYDNLAVSYDSLQDFKKAYHYLVKHKDLSTEIQKNTKNKNIAEVEAKFNLVKEEQKTEIEKNKALRAQFLFVGLALLTLIFFILTFIFYKNYKLKQQNNLEQLHNDSQTRIINATIDAKEEERKNISEILHDSVSALLSSASLHLQASKSQLNSKVPVEITKAQEIVTEASVKIRDLSHTLISSVLLKFGLAFAVSDLCEKYSNSKLTFISDDNGIKRYSQKFEIKIYHVIEELINNIIKHSDAKNASITLIARNGNKLLIQIIDDGKGFDVKKARKKDGLGLSHIEARVKVMKGVFNINSKRGEGTSIFISVPIFKEKMPQNQNV